MLISTYITSLIGNSKVCEFFLEDQKVWDEEKIRNTFNTVDAEAILAVRISQNSTSDRVAWIHLINGQYSVKSTYHFWKTANNTATDVQQSDGRGRILRLCIPHKIRVFLWRLCRNNVSVRNILRGKGVNVPISYTMCSTDIEHLLHLFFDFNFANYWRYMGLQYDTGAIGSSPEWFLNKQHMETSDNLIKIATIVWGIWWARN